MRFGSAETLSVQEARSAAAASLDENMAHEANYLNDASI